MATLRFDIITAFESTAGADGVVALRDLYQWFRENRSDKPMTVGREKAIQREIQAFCSDRKYFLGGDDLFAAVGSGRYRLRSAAVVGPEDYEGTADPVELERRVRKIHGRVSAKPDGTRHPEKIPVAGGEAFKRDPRVVVWVRARAAGKCELCRMAAPFDGEDGEPWLEVHHVKWLQDGGSDTVENAAALCPNCHRRLHYGRDRGHAKVRLYKRVDALVKE